MHKETYQIPYSKSFIEFNLPSSVQVSLVTSQAKPFIEDVIGATRVALDHPIGSQPLRELARRGDRVCIVFTDTTRASPDHILVPALLSELEQAGVRDEDITLLCGIGMHRPTTREEKVAKLGAAVESRYRVIDNDPQNPEVILDCGVTTDGVPVHLNREVIESDLLIATGIVEPHQYAGYSGGYKTVAIGAGGESLIAYTHGPDYVDHPGTRLGQIDGNPFHDAIAEAGQRAGLRFILNVVLDDEKHWLRVSAGEPEQAHNDLVTFAKSIYEVPISHQYDIAIGGVGFPKDVNLYQASRAPSYLFFAPTPVVRDGGAFIIPARCEEGVGAGIGEQRFYRAMCDAPDIQFILDDARRNGYPPGQQRAFVMAKVLEKTSVVIVGSECPDLVKECKMIPASTMREALDIACTRMKTDPDIIIVPHAMLTLPVIQ